MFPRFLGPLLLLALFTPFTSGLDATEDAAKKTLDDAAQKRYALAAKAYGMWYKHEQERTEFDLTLYHLSKHMLEAQLDLDSAPDRQTAAYESHLSRIKSWEKIVQEKTKGATETVFPTVVESLCVEAEYLALKSKVNRKK